MNSNAIECWIYDDYLKLKFTETKDAFLRKDEKENIPYDLVLKREYDGVKKHDMDVIRNKLQLNNNHISLLDILTNPKYNLTETEKKTIIYCIYIYSYQFNVLSNNKVQKITVSYISTILKKMQPYISQLFTYFENVCIKKDSTCITQLISFSEKKAVVVSSLIGNTYKDTYEKKSIKDWDLSQLYPPDLTPFLSSSILTDISDCTPSEPKITVSKLNTSATTNKTHSLYIRYGTESHCIEDIDDIKMNTKEIASFDRINNQSIAYICVDEYMPDGQIIKYDALIYNIPDSAQTLHAVFYKYAGSTWVIYTYYDNSPEKWLCRKCECQIFDI